jgi:hypothetical protein
MPVLPLSNHPRRAQGMDITETMMVDQIEHTVALILGLVRFLVREK